jgi:hypothetical protein
LFLGGAALQRCGNAFVLNTASAAEVPRFAHGENLALPENLT